MNPRRAIAQRIAMWRFRRQVDRMFKWSVSALGAIRETNPGLAATTYSRAREALRDPMTGQVRLSPDACREFIRIQQEALAYEQDRLLRQTTRRQRRGNR